LKGDDFLTKSISGFSRVLESVVTTEDISHAPGLLQGIDPRVKLVSFLLLIMGVSLIHSLPVLGGIFALVILLSLTSKISPGFFLKRVLIFVPIFTLVIAIPALFLTYGQPLVHIFGKIIITRQGALSAGFLLLRVTDSLSLGVLLVLTTPWVNILAALRWARMPALMVDILGMTYRYMFLLLHSANAMFLARRSRVIGSFSGSENRRWLGRALATTMVKSQRLSEDVYLAMLARGYRGEVRVLEDFRLQRRDFIWVAFSLAVIVILFWVSRL
jgi:cobalt/nickel transport system permease protein